MNPQKDNGGEELKACPFCGGKADRDNLSGNRDPDGPLYWIECGFCGAKGPCNSESVAIAAWNTRATPPPSSESNDSLDQPHAFPSVPTTATGGVTFEEAKAQIDRFKQTAIEEERIRLAARRNGLMRPEGDVTHLALLEWRSRVMKANEEEITRLKSNIQELVKAGTTLAHCLYLGCSEQDEWFKAVAKCNGGRELR